MHSKHDTRVKMAGTGLCIIANTQAIQVMIQQCINFCKLAIVFVVSTGDKSPAKGVLMTYPARMLLSSSNKKRQAESTEAGYKACFHCCSALLTNITCLYDNCKNSMHNYMSCVAFSVESRLHVSWLAVAEVAA